MYDVRISDSIAQNRRVVNKAKMKLQLVLSLRRSCLNEIFMIFIKIDQPPQKYDSPVANAANTGKKDGVKLEFNEICIISE